MLHGTLRQLSGGHDIDPKCAAWITVAFFHPAQRGRVHNNLRLKLLPGGDQTVRVFQRYRLQRKSKQLACRVVCPSKNIPFTAVA
jgi:hypothetical protein